MFELLNIGIHRFNKAAKECTCDISDKSRLLRSEARMALNTANFAQNAK